MHRIALSTVVFVSLVLQAPVVFSQGIVPQGALRVPLLTVRLKAGCSSAVQVTSLQFKHEGKGATSDFLRVYVMTGERRLSNGQSVPRKQDIRLRMRGVEIPRCGYTDVSLYGDLSPSAISMAEHRFRFIGATTDGALDGTSTSQASPLKVTPHSTSPSVTVSFLTVHTTMTYGEGRTVARILLTGAGSATQEISAITFTNDGSAANSDLQNIFLETADRSPISTVSEHMDGRTVRIVFHTPMELRRNQSLLLQLRADVRASRTHTIQWTIEEPSDIETAEKTGR